MTDTVYTVIHDQLMRDEVVNKSFLWCLLKDSIYKFTLPISEEFFRFTP